MTSRNSLIISSCFSIVSGLRVSQEQGHQTTQSHSWYHTIAKRDDWTSGEIRHFAKTALATLEAEKPGDTFFKDIAKCVEQTKTFNEACALYEAEKPVEDAESFLDSIFGAIKENGIITNHNYGMRLTKESHNACIKIISAYHAERCRIGYTHNVRVNGVRRNKIIKDVQNG